MIELRLTAPTMKYDEVKLWQYFLLGKKIYKGKIDGDFGPLTHDATVRWQKMSGLEPNGWLEKVAYKEAIKQGFVETVNNPPPAQVPAASTGIKAMSAADRNSLFGSFQFTPRPNTPGAGGDITILGNWEDKNIVTITMSQLAKVNGKGRVRCHKAIAPQLAGLWAAWEKSGLLHYVLTWEGCFVPRYVRGSRKNLSNHAWGSAFDINYEWNKLGHRPASVGQKGTVIPLVPLAEKFGFLWGGYWTSRYDGMHLETYKILSQSEVDSLLASI